MSKADIELIISAQYNELLKSLAETKRKVESLSKEFGKSDKTNYSKTVRGLKTVNDQLLRTKAQVVKYFLSWQVGSRIISGVINNLKRVGTELIDTIRTYGLLRVQLEGLEGSSAGAIKAFKFIKKLTKETNVQVEGVTDGFVKLKAFGLDPMDGTLRSLADVTAKFGGKQEQFKGVILAVGQAWSKGRLQAEEANQLIERGIPVWDIMAKITRKNTAEVQKLSEQGKLGKKAIRGLIDEMGRMSFGSALKASKTLDGQVSIFKDTVKEFYDLIGKSGYDKFLLDQITKINNALEEMNNSGDLAKYANDISDALISMSESIKNGTVFLYDNAEALKLIGKLASGLVALKLGDTFIKWSAAQALSTAASVKNQYALANETKAQALKTASTVKD
ncbi:tape measure protein, partial [Candidatus Babeliales bacterium]|nr:tape measure protein [Candidatus Babeliales bacterium]